MPGQASELNQPSIISYQLALRRLLAKAFAAGSAVGLLNGKAATAGSRGLWPLVSSPLASQAIL